jgi:hypothetical protein
METYFAVQATENIVKAFDISRIRRSVHHEARRGAPGGLRHLESRPQWPNRFGRDERLGASQRRNAVTLLRQGKTLPVSGIS